MNRQLNRPLLEERLLGKVTTGIVNLGYGDQISENNTNAKIVWIKSYRVLSYWYRKLVVEQLLKYKNKFS